MRWTSFFVGLTMMAVTGLAAQAQSRIYSAGSSTPEHRPAAGAQPSGNPTAAANSHSNFNRPIFRTSAPEVERGRGHDRDRDFHCVIPEGCSRIGQSIYPYYVYPPEDETSYGDQQQPTEQVVEPQAPAPTIFENRPGYTPPPIKSYQHSISPSSQTANVEQAPEVEERSSASDPQPTTVLVFRDGHQLEIGNYAIVGETLYNLAGGDGTHKILLADLDLDKTIKANQARGYDFRLPRRQGS